MLTAKILQAQGMTQIEISRRLGVCDRTIRNYLKADITQVKRKKRASKLDPYSGFIKTILEDNPHYNCELIYEKLVASGYTGQISILRDLAKKFRHQILTDAVIRFDTTPGLQAQVDWKEFGTQRVDGSMKTAFVADSDGVFHVQRELLHFAAHYGFEPKRCQIRRPQTKGKVERTIGFLVTNFWPRVKGQNLSVFELNQNVLEWIEMISKRQIRELGESRQQRFEKEKSYLKTLPQIDLDVRRSIVCTVSRESCITIETNKYSVNPVFIGQNVTVRIDDEHRRAEIFHESISFRVMPLETPGSRAVRIFDEDIEAIRQRHRNDIKKKLRLMKRSRQRNTAVEVEIRHPSEYDFFNQAEAMR